MEFAVSTVLWWIAGGAVLLAAYAWSQTRRARDAVPFPDVSLLRAAMATRPSTAGRRHVPAVLTVAALALAAVAIARPALRTPIPRERTTIVLVLDVSGSMTGRDVFPTRLEAAKSAARGFVNTLPAGFRVGVVSFSSQASLVQPVTEDMRLVRSAIDQLQPDGGTAIGDGLQVALASLPPETFATPSEAPLTQPGGTDVQGGVKPDGTPLTAPPIPPAVVLLLTDGQNTEGPDPHAAASDARTSGVPVFTIGMGGRGNPFGGGNRGNGVDETLLQEIAAQTGGQYYFAPGAGELNRIYGDLGRALGWDWERYDIGQYFAIASLVTLTLASILASWWLDRSPRPGQATPFGAGAR